MESTHTATREAIHGRLISGDEALQRLESSLDSFAAAFEDHVISATAMQVLIGKRLAALGVQQGANDW